MAESEDDLTNCPVCFDEYRENGGRLPRLLPCTHTLCENCLQVLIRKAKLDCPECRLKHEAVNGVKSFPQNKYIISHLKKAQQGEVAENKEEICGVFVTCNQHKREKIFFCLEDDCQKQVCIVCFARHHKQHSYVDLELQRQKCEPLLSKIDSLTKDFQEQKGSLTALKEDLEGKIGVIVAEMEAQKEEELKKVIEKYQKAIEDACAASWNYMREIDQEVAEIGEFVVDLDDLKRHTNIVTVTDDDLTKYTEKVEKIATQLSSRTKASKPLTQNEEKNTSHSEESIAILQGLGIPEESKKLVFTVPSTLSPESYSGVSSPSPTGSPRVLPDAQLWKDAEYDTRAHQLQAAHFKYKGL